MEDVEEDPNALPKYLCSSDCRQNWINKLTPNMSLIKPKKFFVRCCGMCGKDFTGSRKALYAWETREFCDKLCLGEDTILE